MYYSSYHFYFYEVRLGVCSMNSKYTSVVGSPRTHVKHAKVQEGLHHHVRWLSFSLGCCCCDKNELKKILLHFSSLPFVVLLLFVCTRGRSGDKTKEQICTKKKIRWTYDLIVFSTRAESRTEQNARNTSKSSAAQQRARNDANDDGLFATKRQHFPIVVHALEEQSTMREYDDDDPSFGKTSVRCSTEFFSMSTTRATKDKNVEQWRQKQRKQREEETRRAFCDGIRRRCCGRVR